MTASRRFGPLHGLVNNAVLRPMKGANGAAEQFAESMRVNATGVMLMHRHFGKTMAEAGRGSIVNIGSIQGMIGPSYELYTGTNMGDMPPDYFFHKGGMENLTRFYAALYGPKSVRVNNLAPGGFFNNQPEPFLQRYCEHTMLGRMADDTDLGGAVIFLLSDASRYITGVNLPVDGGYTADSHGRAQPAPDPTSSRRARPPHYFRQHCDRCGTSSCPRRRGT